MKSAADFLTTWELQKVKEQETNERMPRYLRALIKTRNSDTAEEEEAKAKAKAKAKEAAGGDIETKEEKEANDDFGAAGLAQVDEHALMAMARAGRYMGGVEV